VDGAPGRIGGGLSERKRGVGARGFLSEQSISLSSWIPVFTPIAFSMLTTSSVTTLQRALDPKQGNFWNRPPARYGKTSTLV
jgi:hypothetical protein